MRWLPCYVCGLRLSLSLSLLELRVISFMVVEWRAHRYYVCFLHATQHKPHAEYDRTLINNGNPSGKITNESLAYVRLCVLLCVCGRVFLCVVHRQSVTKCAHVSVRELFVSYHNLWS